jgi:hypothetical protein
MDQLQARSLVPVESDSPFCILRPIRNLRRVISKNHAYRQDRRQTHLSTRLFGGHRDRCLMYVHADLVGVIHKALLATAHLNRTEEPRPLFDHSGALDLNCPAP